MAPSFELGTPFLREVPQGIVLAVKVQPRASRNELKGVHGAELKVSIAAPPVDSAANEALVRFFAEIFGCSRNKVELLRGSASRHKVLLLRGITRAQFLSTCHAL